MVIVAVALTLLLSSLVSILLERYYITYLPSIGNIRTRGVEVYADQELQNKSEGITWDNVDPGSLINETRYVRSISTENIDLDMITENWIYRNSSGIVYNDTACVHLTWDAEGIMLSPDENVKVVFTLRTDLSYDYIQFLVKNQITSFAFDIIIRPQLQTTTGA